MFKLHIETGNAAFDDDNGGRNEVASMLRSLANRLDNGSEMTGGLYDFNGNRVGSFEFVEGA